MTDKIDTLDEKVIQEIELDPYLYANSISIDELVQLLRKLSYSYYHTDNPLITDATYDLLMEILKERDSTNTYLQEIGAPISKDKVSLPYPMASLDKIKPTTDELTGWKTSHDGPYVISDKLDGVSGMLYKSDNKFKLFTRGDTTTGQDITHLIPYLLKDKYKPGKIPNNTAIRGEIIISKKNFETINRLYKNARNTVAGLVNSKHFSVDVAKITDFIGYAVMHPVYQQQTQLEKLKEWGFPLVNYKIVDDLTNDMLSNYFTERRTGSDYDVDGIVVMDNTTEKPTDKNPTNGFAFKMVLSDQVAEVKIISVEWNVTMYGYLKPKLNIEPVNLVGVTIKSVTAFNAKYVVDNKLGPGAVIKLVRSGDVIPHILKVLKPSENNQPQLPDVPYKWNDTNVDFIVKDIHGSSKDNITVKSLAHFFSVMSIKNISEGIITKLVDNGYKSLTDILNADIKKLAEIDGIGEKIITKIFENTRIAFETTNLQTVMAASNIFGRGFGVRKLKVVVDAYPNIMNEKWNDATLKENLMKLDGFEEKTTSQFILYFAKFKHFFATLDDIKLISVNHLKVPVKRQETKGDVCNDMKVVFTGVRDKDLENFITSNGGTISSTVSKNTTILIYAKEGTGSYNKAKELGITTMTIDEFKDKYIK